MVLELKLSAGLLGRREVGTGPGETKAQTPKVPYSRSSHPPLNARSRGMVKAEKGGLLHDSGYVMGRGTVSTQLIFSLRQGTDMSYRLNTQRTGDGGQGSA
jgi:hypothetical protein